MTTHTNETSRRIYARVAGFTFLFYIAAGITSLTLGWRNASDRCAHPAPKLLGPGAWRDALCTHREQEPAIAMLALTCRVVEAVHGESPVFFAVGSLLFSWLLLRGRMIPVGLAWLGVIASALLVSDPASADCRTIGRHDGLVGSGHLACVVANVGVRGGPGAVAAHQGSRTPSGR